MRSNDEIVKAAKREEVMAEYVLILAKTSKLSRNLRERVTRQALNYLEIEKRRKEANGQD